MMKNIAIFTRVLITFVIFDAHNLVHPLIIVNTQHTAVGIAHDIGQANIKNGVMVLCVVCCGVAVLLVATIYNDPILRYKIPRYNLYYNVQCQNAS